MAVVEGLIYILPIIILRILSIVNPVSFGTGCFELFDACESPREVEHPEIRYFFWVPPWTININVGFTYSYDMYATYLVIQYCLSRLTNRPEGIAAATPRKTKQWVHWFCCGRPFYFHFVIQPTGLKHPFGSIRFLDTPFDHR